MVIAMDASQPVYNIIGNNYNVTRKADPWIANKIISLLQPAKDGLFLDVGCGTGNYLNVFLKNGYRFYGVEPSDVMREKAISLCNTIIEKSFVELLPFDDKVFDGATAMFTFHHWKDKQKGLQELFRVLKPKSRLVFLSFTPEQLFNYWHMHYFPEMMRRSAAIVPEREEMITMLSQAGFSDVFTENYFVHDELTDHFFYSNKRKPEKYLDPEVRNGISSFTAFSDPDELKSGLLKLEKDIASGEIVHIMKKYENNIGDYIFYVAQK